MQKSNFRQFSDAFPWKKPDPDWFRILVGVIEVVYAIILFVCLITGQQCVSLIASSVSVVHMGVTLIAHFLLKQSLGMIVFEEISCVVLSVVWMVGMSQRK